MQNPDDFKVFIPPPEVRSTPAQKRTLVVGYIDATFLAILFPFAAYAFIRLFRVPHDQISYHLNVREDSVTLILLLGVALFAFVFGLNAYLVKILIEGGKKREYSKVNRWFFFNLVFFLLTLILETASLFEINSATLISLGSILYRGITLWMVGVFRSELKGEGGQGVVYGPQSSFNPFYSDNPPPYSANP